MELCFLGGTPTALAGDQLIAVSERADDDRLDHPARGDRGGELVERGLVEMPAWLIRVRLDRRNRDIGQAIARCLRGRARRCRGSVAHPAMRYQGRFAGREAP